MCKTRVEKHLFFITSVSEAEQSLQRIEDLHLQPTDTIIISADPTTSIFLKQKNICYRDSIQYCPSARIIKQQIKTVDKLTENWPKFSSVPHRLGKLVQISFKEYLSELEHSLMTAQYILKKEKPRVVHLSSRWTESPFRRYQSEQFNLANLALFQQAQKQNIQLKIFKSPFSERQVCYFIRFFLPEVLYQTIKVTLRQLFSPSPSPSSEKLIIMSNHYQLENLSPILKGLRKKRFPFKIIGKTDLRPRFPFFSLKDFEYQSRSIINSRVTQTIKFFYRWIIHRPSLKTSLSAYSQDYWPLLKPKLEYYFFKEFPLLIDYFQGASLFFQSSVSLLLTSATTDVLSRSVATAAQEADIPVIELQHGILVTDIDKTFRTNDYYAIWGPAVLSLISGSEKNPEQYPITGYPLFDQYQSKRPSKKLQLSTKKKLRLNPKLKTLLILATFPSGMSRLAQTRSAFQFLKTVFKTISEKKSDWQIIFRPHPSTNAFWAIRLAKLFNLKIIYDNRKYDLKTIIAVSDLIIANPTTAMVEAMFQQKPVFSFVFSSEKIFSYQKTFFVTSNAIQLFKNSSQLKSLLHQLTDSKFRQQINQGQKKFLKQYCSISDSKTKSSDRVIDFVLNAL